MIDKYDELYDAIGRKDWATAERLILTGVEDRRDYYDYDDWPLIFSLIEAGQEDLAILWLDHEYPYEMTGGKINATILHWAAKYGMARLIEQALQLRMDIDNNTVDDHAPLWFAANSGHLEIVALLLKNGANVDGLDDTHKPTPDWTPQIDTPLCASANAEIAEFLLSKGASLEIGPSGWDFIHDEELGRPFGLVDETLTPLTVAALRGRMDVVRVFLAHGIPLDSQPLRFLAARRDAGTAALLVSLGTNPDGEPGKEPLRIAARAGNAAFCRILLDNGAKFVPEALNLSVLSGNRDCVELFLEYGDPASAIRLAARRGAGSILDKLLEYRPDLASHGLLGAIEGCRLKLAREMLDRGADPNFHDNDGKTPLLLLYSGDRLRDSYRYFRLDPSRYPAKFEHRPLWRPSEKDFESDDYFPFYIHRPDNWVELLNLIDDDVREIAAEFIRKGADINARDNMGRSVLWHACCRSWLKAIPWLAGLGLNISERDSEGTSAFDAGCLYGEKTNVEAMLPVCPEIDAQDADGDTALIKCARKHIETGESPVYSSLIALLSAGANPDIENNKGESFRKLAEADRMLKRWLEE